MGELVIRSGGRPHPHLSRESRDGRTASIERTARSRWLRKPLACHSCRTLGAMAKTPESAAIAPNVGVASADRSAPRQPGVTRRCSRSVSARLLGRICGATFVSLLTPDPATMATVRVRRTSCDRRSPREPRWLRAPPRWMHGDRSNLGSTSSACALRLATMSPPHFHPEERYIAVLKGTWWVGAGPKWDRNANNAACTCRQLCCSPPHQDPLLMAPKTKRRDAADHRNRTQRHANSWTNPALSNRSLSHSLECNLQPSSIERTRTSKGRFARLLWLAASCVER